MMEAMPLALAVQLVVAGLAKLRAPVSQSNMTLLAALWPRVPVSVFAGIDLALAALFAWPAGSRLTAGLVSVAILASEGAVVAGRKRGIGTCGCVGSVPKGGAWREHAFKAVVLMEAFGLFVGADPQPRGLAYLGAVLVTIAAVLVLIPQLVGVRRRALDNPRAALRALLAYPGFESWRPHILNPRPAEVRRGGGSGSWRIVLEAWSGGRPVLLVAVVSSRRVRLQAHDATTMARIG